MWSVMLVDDEPTVLEGLRDHIDWEALGARVVCTASGGKEALVLFEQHRPQLVITDIYMPGMDGMQLMQTIHDQAPETTFVVVSGYDEFEYARRSLQFGVVDYVLKPATVSEITTVLQRAVAQCQESALQRQLAENIPCLQEYFLMRLLREAPDPEEARFLGLADLLEGPFSVALVAVERPAELPEEAWQLTRLTAREIAARDGAYALPCFGGEMPVLLHGIADPEDWCRTRLREIQSQVSGSVTIGLSRPCSTVRDAYAEARQALTFMEILGAGRLISLEKVEVGTGALPPYPVDRNQRLLEALRFGDEAEVVRQVQEAFRALGGAPLNYVRGACIELYGLAATALSERDQSMDAVASLPEFWTRLSAMTAAADMAEFVAGRLAKAACRLNVRQKSRHEEVLNEIDRIIAARYCEDLTMDDVAKAVYLSRTYVAYLFKQVRGQSFLEHLTRFRMGRAREFLMTTTLSVYEIAEKVGYKNSAYFSRVFREHYGLMPSELRKSS